MKELRPKGKPQETQFQIHKLKSENQLYKHLIKKLKKEKHIKPKENKRKGIIR